MPPDQPTVVMFHVGRCGSTVVAEMLGRHNAVTWDGEVFEPAVRRKIGFEDLEPDEFLRERREGTDDIYGFEIKYLPSHHQRVLGLDLDGLIALTDRVGVSHYVTLHRHNYLRRVVSGAIGRERRRWHRTHAEPAPTTAVRLDPKAVPFGPRQTLLATFEEMKTGEASLETVLDGRSALHLVYEEDVEDDPAEAYRQICDLIGVASEDTESRLGRTGAAPLTSLLTNFDEIAELLTGTEYEWMLDKQTRELMLPPFWVIGAPRSGTTFLAKVLDHHPEIFLTNETRVMLLFNQLLTRSVNARRLLATSREEILDSLWRQVPDVIEQIYRDLGAVPGQRWGDKYPQYADGAQEPEALATIDRLFPTSQYVHIIRDPRAVVASIVAKGWLGFDEAISAWRSFVSHARAFGAVVGPNRYHELRFERLVTHGTDTVREQLEFLGLQPHDDVDRYLGSQESSRDRLSYPMGQPGSIGPAAWVGRLDEEQVRTVESKLGEMMSEFGYEPI